MSHYSDKHYKPDMNFDKLYFDMFFKRGDKTLDIGCSIGNFVIQDSKNIVGIDIDETSVRIAKKRKLNVKKHDVTKKLPFDDKFFDTVNCRHVLEHMENPLFLLKEIFRVLKKNGKLILMTDEPKANFWDDYTHKKPFTKKSLNQIAYDAGFKKYDIYYFPQGVFGLGFLYRNNIISYKAAKKINKFFGKFFKKECLILEAVK